jgi:DNA-binding XRE family transcriptional regulator
MVSLPDPPTAFSTGELPRVTSLVEPPAGPFLFLHPYLTTYVALCKLMLYNIRVEFPVVEVNVEKLQELRINQGLSQRRLAELAGVANTSVWKIEHGGGANPATLKKLADVLGVKPVDLLKERR